MDENEEQAAYEAQREDDARGQAEAEAIAESNARAEQDAISAEGEAMAEIQNDADRAKNVAELLRNYAAANAQIDAENAKHEAITTELRADYDRLGDYYYKRIETLKEKQRNAQEKVQKAKDAQDAAHKALYKLAYEPIEKVNRIMDLLQVAPHACDLLPEEVATPRSNWRNNAPIAKEDLGYIFDDEYYKLRAFIVTNDRPKNVYSLCVVGKHIFPEKLLPRIYDYGSEINENREASSYFTVKYPVARFPSIDEAKAYFDKNKDKLARNVQEYLALKKEWQDAKRDYRLDDFKQIILEKLHENRAARTGTCSKCGTVTGAILYESENVNLCDECKFKQIKKEAEGKTDEV